MKSFKIAPLLVALVLLASCRKTYHCDCLSKDTDAQGVERTTEYNIGFKEWSKENAKESCNRMSDECKLR